MNVSGTYKKLSIQAKASICYVIASLCTRGLSIITTPFFTRIMSTEEIGVVSNFATLYSIFMVFATLGLTSGGFNVAMLEYKEKRDQYQSSILFLSTISGIIVSVCVWLLKDLWSDKYGMTYSITALLSVILVIIPAENYWLARQRYEYKYKSVVAVTMLQTLLSTVLAIILVLNLYKKNNPHTSGHRLFGTYFFQTCFALYFLILIFYKGKKLYNKEYWLFSLKLGIPLMIHSLAKTIFDVSDRLMISSMIGLSEVGIYSTLYTLSSLSLIVWTAINSALIPTIFNSLKAGGDSLQEVKKTSNVLIIIYSIASILITMISPEIIKFLTTDKYYEAIYMIPPVAAGIYLTCLYNLFSNVIVYHKKTSFVMISTVISAVSNIALNYIFIPLYGYSAAAYTTLFSYIILSVLQFWGMKIVEKRYIFNIKFVVIISSLTVLLNVACVFLYGFPVIRYILLLLFAITCLLCKNQLIPFIKKLIHK